MEAWIVDTGDEVYGPFIGLTEASVFVERFQDRQRIRIRQLSNPHKLTYADIVNRVCEAQAMKSQDELP